MTYLAPVLSLVTSLLLFAGCASSIDNSSDETPAQLAPSAARQSQLVMADISAAYPAMNATVILQDRVVWSFTHGRDAIDASRPTTKTTRFNTYSVAKAVTGLAFARLIEQGDADLDSKVSEIAPDLSETFHDIRVQDILSHTSGIRHYASPADWISYAARACSSPMDGLDYFDTDALVHQPGDAETYSTFAFVLASELLVRLTDAPTFIDALNTALGPWSDLKLDHAGAEKAQPLIKASRLPAMPPNADPEDLVVLPFESAECKFGGGGLIMSSEELARVGAALHNGLLMPPLELPKRLQPWSPVSRVVYGGGVQTRKFGDQETLAYNVSGGAPGGRSILITLIEPKISIAIAGNLEGPRLEESAWKLAEIWASATRETEPTP